MSFVKRLCRTIVASALLFLSAAPMHAGIDTATYDAVNGIVCKNMWLKSRVLDATEFEQLPFISNFLKVRTATIYGSGENAKAILGYSKPTMNADSTGTEDTAHIIIIDLATGEYEKEVKLSCNGADITHLLCATQIGVDDFGNLYFGGFVSDILTTPLKLYRITDIDNGTAELAGELSIPSEEVEALNLTTTQRIYYFDICGDITGQQSHAIVMAALQNSTKVCRWRLEQGMSDWYGDFDGYVTWDDSNLVTYPADQPEWSGAPMVHILTSESDGGLDGDCFYVDGYTTYPVIYGIDGLMRDGFMNAPEELNPQTITNGITEFSVGGKLFIAYSLAQYNGTPGCQIRVAELVDQAFTNMQSYWELPADGLGTTSDGGTRIHSLSTMKITDENGLDGVYLLNYKCNNGIGLYLIAQNGFIDPYTGEAVTAPENTTPEVSPSYSIALSTNSASIMQGESMQLSATVSPEGSAVTYTSLDEAVATVSESGLITAVAEGQTSIIAALSDDTTVADTCVVTVETFNKPNTFAVEDFRIKRDSTFTMPVAMHNDSTITAFQCDIVLPQGITVTKTDDVIDVTLDDERKQDHTINAELLDDGTLRVISSSLTLAKYTGNSGNLFNIGLAVDENGVDGKHTIEIKNIKLSSVTGSQCNAPATKATAEIYTFEQGDANGDHKIDVADVVSITQVILGKTEEAVNETVPDYNNDKVVDVFDIVEIIKYILSQQSTESQAVTMSAFETAKDAVSIESFTVDRFGTGTIDIACAISLHSLHSKWICIYPKA